MDFTRAFIEREAFEADVREVERELSGPVVHMSYDLDYDSTGDPAVHFKIVLPDESFKRDKLLDEIQHVSYVVKQKLQPVVRWGVYPYFRFRSKSTYESSPEPGWG